MSRTVLCFGTFDGIHPGHLYYLNEAKNYGDRLVVVVARDETVKDVKGRLPKYNEKERLQHLKELKIVDKAILGNFGDKLDIVLDIMPSVICLGYDQRSFTDNLDEKLRQRGLTDIKVMRIRPYMPHKYKSSKMN